MRAGAIKDLYRYSICLDIYVLFEVLVNSACLSVIQMSPLVPLRNSLVAINNL